MPDHPARRESAVLRPAPPAEGPTPTLSILEWPSASGNAPSDRPGEGASLCPLDPASPSTNG